MMHAANVEKSERLQRVLNVLKLWRGRKLTTRDIRDLADVCAVNSIISELRANGYKIDCQCIGRGRFQYKLS